LSFVVRLSNLFLPKPFRGSVVLEYLFSLARIVELDLVHAFSHPVEKEPGRSLADSTRCRFNLEQPKTANSEFCRNMISSVRRQGTEDLNRKANPFAVACALGERVG